MAEKKKWMQDLDLKKNSLRKELHVKEGEKIPKKKLLKATHSKNPIEKKRAVLAENFAKTRAKR